MTEDPRPAPPQGRPRTAGRDPGPEPDPELGPEPGPEPGGADADLFTRPHRRHRTWDVLAVVAAGGGLGSAARYGLARALPSPATGFPWATFLTNVTGCLLLGVLMVYVLEVWPPRRYVRPFLGVGFLGGYTTFSTYTVELLTLLDA